MQQSLTWTLAHLTVSKQFCTGLSAYNFTLPFIDYDISELVDLHQANPALCRMSETDLETSMEDVYKLLLFLQLTLGSPYT